MLDLSKYSYISFDVFDTLIFRSVAEPEDVFSMVQEVYCAKNGFELRDFYSERILAERKARSLKGVREITFEEIYDNLVYDIEVKSKLKNIEIQVELDNCVPNIPMIDFLKSCKELGKKIIITTDMYLPRIFFEKLLNKLKVDVDYIIISSEEGETKRTGRLYPILLEKIGIKSNELLHIGDNKLNDIEQANNNGIDAIERWYDLKDFYIKVKNESIVDNHINSLYCLYNNQEYNCAAYFLGFTIIGPLLFDFCYWLHKQKKEQNLDRLVFLSREGYLLKKCYNLLFPEEDDDTDYICLNKNLLRLPLLQGDRALIFFKDSILMRQFYTWDQIYDSFLITSSTPLREELSYKLGVDYKMPISRIELDTGTYDHALTLLLDLSSDVIKSQSDCLYHYLVQHNMLCGKIGLVNNSIDGNGQLMLETFLEQKGINHNIFGLQFMHSEKCQNNLVDRYSTYFDSLSMTNFSINVFYKNCLVFEHLLFEPVGTSLYFEKNDGFIKVVKKKQNKEVLNNDFIEEVQKHTLSFLKLYISHTPLTCNGFGIKRFLNFIRCPDRNIATFVCELWDEDIDGDRKLADSTIPMLPSYIFFKNIPKSIFWKEGYLVMKGVSSVLLRLISIQSLIIFYRNNKRKILNDLKILITS